MKEGITNLGRMILDFFKKLALGINSVFVFIGGVIKTIAIFFGRIFYQIFRTLSNIIKTIGAAVWKHFIRYIYLALKFLIQKLHLIIQTIFKGIYRYVLKPVFKSIKYISIKTFCFFKLVFKFIKFVSQEIYLLISPFLNLIRKVFRFIIIKIYQILKFILQKIWWLLRQLIKFLELWFHLVQRIFIKICIFMYKLFNKLIFYLKLGLVNLKRALKNLPEWLYLSIYIIFVYLYLIIRFLTIDLIKFILWTLPRNIYKFLVMLLGTIIEWLEQIIVKFFKMLYRIITFIFKKLWQLTKVVYDFWGQYYYVILLMPLVLPLLVLLFTIFIIKNIFIFLHILLSSLTNYQIRAKYDIFYVQGRYLPSFLLIKNYQAISKKYHAKTLFTQKFINLMYTIDLLVWQSIYVILFIPLGFIILLPITIIMIVYYFFSGSNRVLFTKVESINGLFSIPKIKNYCFKIFSDYYYDQELKLYVLKDPTKNSLIVQIYENDFLIEQTDIKVAFDSEYEIVKEINVIVDKLINYDDYPILLPDLENEKILVKYEKVHSQDLISSNQIVVRKGASNTSLRIILVLDNLHLERVVRINDIINPNIISEALLKQGKLKLYHQGTFMKFLDNKLSFIFIETPEVNKDGIITTKTKENVEVKFYLEKYPQKIYQTTIEVLFTKSQIKSLLALIKEPEIDFINKAITFQEEIIMDEFNTKEIIWYVNDKAYSGDLLEFYFTKKRLIFKACIMINNKYYYREFRYQNKFLFAYELDKLQTNLQHANLDADYLKLPIFLTSYVRIVKWKSLQKQYIKSSGKVINKDFKDISFEVTLYRNLFVKKKMVVSIQKENNGSRGSNFCREEMFK